MNYSSKDNNNPVQNREMVDNKTYENSIYYKPFSKKYFNGKSRKKILSNESTPRSNLSEENLFNEISNSYNDNKQILSNERLPLNDNPSYKNVSINNIGNTLRLVIKIVPSKRTG
ncbi:Hypothetical protein SRAE_1000076600 [Strongyloides ratti]|uniref:Uncharacterized protein n=1 Tax=Strongyloides ratti TaxID=34506 RepID=A0A090KYH7_STRRB|nr:Hypothetical protein SRAE_1000076600 [Strongyloides ratti]CEF62496.1 Hypothetical protein SRAE_1000076600 [Strongyloides ratti]